MQEKITVGISNRHLHLNKESYDKLFKEPLTKKKNLNQKGEFAANETVTIKVGNQKIENVRIVGPLRDYNQIEISQHDARLLGVTPPVRRSGDVKDSLEVVIETSYGSIETNGLILAERHVHMNEEQAQKYGLKDRDNVKIHIAGERSGVIDAKVKVSANAYLELHIDTDDANAFLLNDNDIVTMTK